MVWDGSANGGFTGGNVKPWLPVKAPQLARNVERQAGVDGSVLESYRAMLAFRKANPALTLGDTRFLDLPEPVLGFVRGGAVLCLFNLSPQAITLRVSGVAAPVGPAQAAAQSADKLTLGPNGYAFLPVQGIPAVQA